MGAHSSWMHLFTPVFLDVPHTLLLLTGLWKQLWMLDNYTLWNG